MTEEKAHEILDWICQQLGYAKCDIMKGPSFGYFLIAIYDNTKYDYVLQHEYASMNCDRVYSLSTNQFINLSKESYVEALEACLGHILDKPLTLNDKLVPISIPSTFEATMIWYDLNKDA